MKTKKLEEIINIGLLENHIENPIFFYKMNSKKYMVSQIISQRTWENGIKNINECYRIFELLTGIKCLDEHYYDENIDHAIDLINLKLHRKYGKKVWLSWISNGGLAILIYDKGVQ